MPSYIYIIFNLEFLNCFTPARKEVSKFKRIHLWNSMRYGTARIAMKKSAIDKACLDLVYSSEDEGKALLIERIESRNGIHTVNSAVKLGVGSDEYELIRL